MPQYVDGFVIPIKKSKLNAYKKMALMGRKAWMKHGALSYYECIGDDFMKYGLGFKKLCKLKAGETFIFAFIVFKSKAHRNKVNAKVMKEFSSMSGEMKMPFDENRMSVAGCKVIVN